MTKTNTEVVEEGKKKGINLSYDDQGVSERWLLKALEAKDTQAEEMIREVRDAILEIVPYLDSDQEESLTGMVEHIAQKYGIDLTNNTPLEGE